MENYAKKNGLEMTCKDVVMDPAKPGFIHDADMLVSNSGKRKWEYQSYDDYIVAFEQRYLNANELKDPAALAAKFRQILEAGMDGDKKDTDKGNFIQVEISKGLFGLSPKIREEQGRFSSINPKAYDAVALLYVRSYLFHFWPKSVRRSKRSPGNGRTSQQEQDWHLTTPRPFTPTTRTRLSRAAPRTWRKRKRRACETT